MIDKAVCVCVCVCVCILLCCTCVLIHKYLHEEQQTWLKGRGFRWKGLQAPFKDCNLPFPKIVCTTVCLWHDYFFGGHTILCSSESQKGFREHQSVIWWCLLPGTSFSLKSHNHLRYERSLIFEKRLSLGKALSYGNYYFELVKLEAWETPAR